MSGEANYMKYGGPKMHVLVAAVTCRRVAVQTAMWSKSTATTFAGFGVGRPFSKQFLHGDFSHLAVTTSSKDPHGSLVYI